MGGGQSENAARRERLRMLALETIDLSKDPYFMKNHSGGFEWYVGCCNCCWRALDALMA